MNIKRIVWRGIKKSFDKAFYRSKGWQFAWLVGGIGLLVGIGCWVGRIFKVEPWRIVELILDPGAFVATSIGGNTDVIIFQ